MDRATQQECRDGGETSAAARNLASEVGGLADKAAQFNRLGSGTADHARRAPSRPSAGRLQPARPPAAAAAVPALVASTGDDGDWTEF